MTKLKIEKTKKKKIKFSLRKSKKYSSFFLRQLIYLYKKNKKIKNNQLKNI